MTTTDSIEEIVEQVIAPRPVPTVREKPTRLGKRGRPPIRFPPLLVVLLRKQNKTWADITKQMKNRLKRLDLSERTVMRMYGRYLKEYPEHAPVKLVRQPVAWWWRGLVTAALGREASLDGQEKRCGKCMAWRGKDAFHVALRKADGTAYLRAICNLCWAEREKVKAQEAMASIYQGPDAHVGPPIKVTREELWESYGKHKSWRKVARRLGVTEQTVYRVRNISYKKADCWYVRGAVNE